MMTKVNRFMARFCKCISYGFVVTMVVVGGMLLVCMESMAMVSEWFDERADDGSKNN
jgi:hypothetical protein